jgi:hypothetical protein
MVNDPPPLQANTNVGALHPHPTEQYGSSTMLAGSELTGTFCLSASEGCSESSSLSALFQFPGVKKLWKTRFDERLPQLGVTGAGRAVLNF